MSENKFEVEQSAEGIDMLEGSEVVEFDESLAEITLTNPDNDWSEKETDLVGGDE